MATHISDEMLSHFVPVTKREQDVENKKDAGHASAVMPPKASSSQRRCEERKNYRQMCSYEIRETIGGESVVIGEGGGLHGQWECGRNTSPHGIGASREAVNRSAHLSLSMA